MGSSENVRNWLRANDYDDIVDVIDEIMLEWKASGKKTRRNWWEVLSGGVKGRPSIIAGREFPVLRVAQKRQGKPVTKNALSHHKKELAPGIQTQIRWTQNERVKK